MGDAFVLHNELSEYYSLSDDWMLAQAFIERKDTEEHVNGSTVKKKGE